MSVARPALNVGRLAGSGGQFQSGLLLPTTTSCRSGGVLGGVIAGQLVDCMPSREKIDSY